jgi:hypothetical protein
MDAEGRKNEPITPLKSPPKRTLPASSRGERWPKMLIFRISEPLAKIQPLSRGAL